MALVLEIINFLVCIALLSMGVQAIVNTILMSSEQRELNRITRRDSEHISTLNLK